MNHYTIRKVTEEDLPLLDPVFDSEFQRQHADDLAAQHQGTRSFFVAWLNEQPLGHAFVHWAGPRAPEPLAAYPDVPEIMRLAVLEPFQRRGIAAGLIRVCENEAREREFSRIGMGTDPNIDPSDNLYYRLGYQDLGLPLFDDVYKRDINGKVVTIRDPARFVVKNL